MTDTSEKTKIILLICGLCIWAAKSFVFLTLWGWFIVPVFGLPQLVLGEAFGIIIVIEFLSHSTNTYIPPEDYLEEITHSVAVLILYLGAGFLLHLCI